MTYQTFEKIVLLLRNQSKQIDTMYDMGIDLTAFTDRFYSVIGELMKTIYGQQGYDTFQWFCYERDYGIRLSKYNPAAWDENDNPICYDIKSLYEHLESNKSK